VLVRGHDRELRPGTRDPFTVLGAPRAQGIYSFSYTPASIPGMAEDPVHQDQVCYGLDLRTYDTAKLRTSGKLNLTWLKELYAAYPDKARFFDQKFHRQIATSTSAPARKRSANRSSTACGGGDPQKLGAPASRRTRTCGRSTCCIREHVSEVFA
jgi:hypothetical protein